MSDHTSVLEWLGLSGLLAMLAAFASHIRLTQRVTSLEDRADKSDDNGERLARIEAILERVERRMDKQESER